MTIHGRRIGFIGLVESEWLLTLSTLNPEDVVYEDFCVCAKRMATELKEKEGVEIIIALTHMRGPNDERLASEVPEVNLILGGHDHHYDVKPVGPYGTWVLKSGTNFRDITALKLEFPAESRKVSPFVVAKADHEEIVSSIQEDQSVQPFIHECIEKVGAAMDNVIGKSQVDLDSSFTSIRTRETNIGNFIADAMRKRLKTDIGFLNSGTMRADAIIEKGPLSMHDLMNLLPILEEMCILQLTGQQVLSILENSVSMYPRLEGRFAQVSGIEFIFDAAQPSGKRVLETSIRIDGKALNKDQKYTVGTMDYLRQGKDGYDVLKDAICLADGEMNAVLPAIVREHLEAASTRKRKLEADGGIKPEVEGRIVCLNPVQ